MTEMSDWRRAYHLLHHNCGLSHFAVREIFNQYLGGLSFHRNLLHTELTKRIKSWEMEIEAFAVMLNTDDVEQFTSRLMTTAWSDADADPDLLYVVVREVASRVRAWNEGWSESDRLTIHNETRRILNWEQSQGRKAWTDRHLLTYLRVRNIAIEV